MSATIPPFEFPEYGECSAKSYLDELKRLFSPNVLMTEHMDGKAAASLLVCALRTYSECRDSPRWQQSPILSRLASNGKRFNLVCSSLFDLICNAEYIRGRVTNRSWIYCHRGRERLGSDVYAYYSYLKQCPRCCQDLGLERRLSGAQHKPSSHHIGEITTTATVLFLTLLGASGSKPLRVGTILKQSHDVDAVAWRDDLLVLFEIKASPLVTYPLRVKMIAPFEEEGDETLQEIDQHRLIDVEHKMHEVSLFLANTGRDIPLGKGASNNRWPYPEIESYIGKEDGLLDYIEAWGEIFIAYSIPKTARQGREVILGYLANGWGDEIDSNKTKAGLGRTDDIKKGTYQLLKFGAYYREGSPKLPVRGALVANLDPVFMYKDYMEKIIDARWAPNAKFSAVPERPDHKEIPDRDLFYIYDAVVAFNRPVINDPQLEGCFDFDAAETALLTGKLEPLFKMWAAK